jgi:methylated-DNA-[protein]-cysteine S-methyltransferase
MESVFYGLDSPLGVMLIEARDESPVRIFLPGSGIRTQAAIEEAPPEIRRTAREIGAYFSGAESDRELRADLLDGLATSDFTRRVLERVSEIPRGRTASYGEVAALAGNPRAARAVGGVMKSNPFPIIIPCHRVIRSDGSVGGFGGGREMKAWLLTFEGGQPSPVP